jgi:thioredoxin-dependent peroxiredoxin
MTQLKPGDKAPLFKGTDQNGLPFSIADLKGKKMVLYFYPQDDTPTCTVQACNLRDHYGLLRRRGFEVVGVSPDSEKAHQKFEKKFDLPFTLLADPQHKIIDKYGVWGEKELFGRKYMGLIRTTFVIDEKGTIRFISLKPKSAKHAQEILAAWDKISSSPD